VHTVLVTPQMLPRKIPSGSASIRESRDISTRGQAAGPKVDLEVHCLEQQAGRFLEVSLIRDGSAYFVPAPALADVQVHLDGLNKQFTELVNSFMKRFEEMKFRVQERHPDFWNKCLRLHYPRDTKALRDKFYFKYFVFRVAGMGETQEMSVEEAVAMHAAVQERTKRSRNAWPRRSASSSAKRSARSVRRRSVSATWSWPV